MSKMSNYTENLLLDRIVRNTAWTAKGTVYLAIFTAFDTTEDTGDGSSGITEVTTSGTAYARQAITFGTDASSGSISNTATITFAQATANWGTGTHFGIYDASSAGNLLFWGTLSSNVLTGEVMTISSAALSVSIQNAGTTGNISTQLSNEILNALLRGASFTNFAGSTIGPAVATHVSIASNSITTDTFTEITDIAPRQVIGTWSAASTTANGGETGNSADLVWPAASAGYTVTSAGLLEVKTNNTITRVTTVATATSAANHNYRTNDSVVISGASPSQYNGTFTITVTSSTVFTYTMGSDPGSSASPAGTSHKLLYRGDITSAKTVGAAKVFKFLTNTFLIRNK